jgi:hypothetical protein
VQRVDATLTSDRASAPVRAPPSPSPSHAGPSPESVGKLFASDWAQLALSFTDEAGPLRAEALALSDFHTLRALARAWRILDEASVELRCRNCAQEFAVKPASGLELGPYVDGELDDPELDARFAFDVAHTLQGPRQLAGPDRSWRVRLAPRSLAEARALHDALGDDAPLDVEAGRALGLDELDGTTDPRALAERLESDPELFDAVALLFEEAHYPPRLTVRHRCPECQMAELVPVPSEREFTTSTPGEPPGGDEREAAPVNERPSDEPAPLAAFVSVEEFEDRVRRLAPEAYARAGLRNIDLTVVEGPADVDEAGEPLLGSYQPPDPDALPPQPPEVRLYYRTFAAAWDDGDLADLTELDAEITETLRHELEHHLGFLSGEDAVADEEALAIEREHVGRVGRGEANRRALTALVLDFAAFLRGTWVIWLIVGLGMLIAWRATHP